MKLAFISDVHLGDENCCMFRIKDEIIQPGSRFEAFMDSIGRDNDYLVLMGDILDFAIEKPYNVYRLARKFFQTVKDEGIAKEIIYVPGNHDFNFWQTYEQQINVIHQLDKGDLPKHYRWALPGFILDDGEENGSFHIPTVSKSEEKERCQYGGLFIDNITKPATCFNLVYPNLYIVSKSATTLVTHGHYLEDYWSMGSDWFPSVFGENLDVGHPIIMTEEVGLNFPLCQLSSSGLGLAGPLTTVIGQLEHEIKRRKYGNLEEYLDNFRKQYVKTRDYKTLPWFQKAVLNQGLKFIQSLVMKKVKKIVPARNNNALFKEKNVEKRFWSYFDMCQKELMLAGRNGRLINSMLMGHTHVPTPWGDAKAPIMIRSGNTVPIYNTGGWLDTTGKFTGANIVHYQTEKGFWSNSIE